MASWYDDITNGVSDWVHGVTDTIGLTDSEAPDRAQQAAEDGMSSANAQLDADLQPGMGALDTAQYGRSLGHNLDVYGQQMEGAMDQTQQAGDLSLGEMVAGNAPIFVLMSYWSDPESGMGGDSFDIEGFFYGTSLDNEKKKLEVLKGTVPELAERGNLYVEEYRPEYHGEFETVWPDLTSLVKQPADTPEDPYSDDSMWF